MDGPESLPVKLKNMSFVVITFDDLPEVGDTLTLNINTQSGLISRMETFVNTRSTSYQSAIGANINAAATNYGTAFNIDYNGMGYYGIEVDANEVIIELEDPYWTFDSVDSSSVNISYNITNTDPPAEVDIETSLSASATPCSTLNIDVTASGGTEPYTLNIYDPEDLVTPIHTNNSWGAPGNEVSYEAARGASYVVEVVDDNDVSASETVAVPRSLVAEDFSINTIPSPTGATVTFNQENIITGIGTIEFSLDGVDYQTENFFSGQADGDYTVYIRDGFGCVLTINYTISNLLPEPDTFFLISEANSLRFSKVEADTQLIRANYYNRLSCEEPTAVTYQEKIRFESQDVITTQFKANYETIAVTIVDAVNNEINVPVTQQTTNIGQTDRRDCTYFNAGGGTTGVYFISGNTYDYDTELPNGTYTLENGNLPNFIQEGMYITVNGLGTHEVVRIRYSEELEVWYAELNITYLGAETESVCSTIYNLHEYEVYEFEIDMADYEGNNFRVIISLGDAPDQLQYISELVNVKQRQRMGLALEYYNTHNLADMNYQTGIRNILRLDGNINIVLPESSNTTELTDERPVLLKAKLYKNFELRAYRLTTAMAFKLVMALHHNRLTINGLRVTLKDEPSMEPASQSNQYHIKARLVEGGNAVDDV